MPDDMLEDCIAVAGKALNDHDFESEGVKVGISLMTNYNVYG